MELESAVSDELGGLNIDDIGTESPKDEQSLDGLDEVDLGESMDSLDEKLDNIDDLELGDFDEPEAQQAEVAEIDSSETDDIPVEKSEPTSENPAITTGSKRVFQKEQLKKLQLRILIN